MLERIRAFLEEEYQNIIKRLSENKKSYARNKLYIALKKKFINSYLAKEKAQKKIVWSPILLIISTLICSIIITLAPEATPLLIIKVPFIFANTFLTYMLISNIIKYKKCKKEIAEYQQELVETYPEYGTGLLINEFALQYDRERQEGIRQGIYADEVYLKGLYDILQDDNLIDKMRQYNYHLYKELFKEAFEAEWQAYLEEISKIEVKDIHLNDKENLKKAEPIKLDLKPKREKSHNLAIK